MELHDVFDVVRVGVNITYNRKSVTGETPKTIIQRRSDLLFFNGTSFEETVYELTMTEADKNRLPGYYYYDFDQSIDGTKEEYLVRVKNTGKYKFITDELYQFKFDLSKKIDRNFVWLLRNDLC